MGENQITMNASAQLQNKKANKKNKKKRKHGLKKNQIVKVQGNKVAKINVNKNNEKAGIKKENSSMEAEEKETNEHSGITSKENMNQDTQKGKKRKIRNNRIFTSSSEKMELPALLDQETDGRTSHRDERTLYVRIPPALEVRDKSLLEPIVPSAIDIRLPRLSPKSIAKFCYMEFETVEEATRIKEKLPNITINSVAFYADHVGKKAKSYPAKEPRVVDPVRLYVGGLPAGIKASDLRDAFPTATQVLYKKASHRVCSSHAYIIFATHEDALKAFESSSSLKIRGKDVIVMFATYKNNTNKDKDQITNVAKKQKTEDVEMEEGSG